ncbi:MAG: 2-oxo acid dehydrogenase subunit E2 [bacterium]
MGYEFRFPDIGEGVTEGELLAWKVREGDIVAEDQPLAELETDKAVVEMPSPRAGRVARLHVGEGDIVNVGDVLVTIDDGAADAQAGAEAAGAEAAGAAAVGETPRASAAAPVAPEPYTGSVVGRLEEAPEEEPVEGAAPARPPVPEGGPPMPLAADAAVLAMPSVRALARDLGVDLAAIRGTGSGGRILKQDVEDVAEAKAYGVTVPGRGEPTRVPQTARPSAGAATQGGAERPLGEVPGPAGTDADFPAVAPVAVGLAAVAPVMGGTIEQDAFGVVERVAFRGVRRTMARRMAESVAKQAQVTTMDEADVTIIKRIREKERAVTEERGVRLTYLAFVVKACTAALRRFPRLNAILEESGDEFVLKRYCNVGIAIDTKSGLVVPNIKEADQMSIFRIAEEIVDLVARADERRLDLRDLHGGTFTISNYGAVGSTFATPVINYPEVALLGMGRVRELPVVREGKVVTRLMLPLSLTIDHQLVDGAEAARFLNLVIGYLEDPDLLLLEGA